VIIVAGCTSDVATAPPIDKKALSALVTKQEEKDGAKAPKSIKGKVLRTPGGEPK
jgi:hypothetical protein